MKAAMTITLPLVAMLLLSASAARVTPIEKVIELLNGMLSTSREERKQEQIDFAAFKQFCDDVTTDKQNIIKAAQVEVKRLTAEYQKLEADIERLGREIEAHEAEVEGWKKETDAALADREVEHSDFLAKQQDLSETLAALQEAIPVIKKQAFDRPQAAMLLQAVQSLARVPVESRRQLNAFLERNAEEDPEMADPDLSPPEANAYEFQSQGIIDMLEKLEEKFRSEKVALEKDEMNNRHAAETLLQDLAHSIKVAKSQIQAKSTQKGKAEQAYAAARLTLADTIASMKDDQTYLDDLIGTCRKKSEMFESRQELRAGEIEALEKALQLLSSDAVSGAAEKHLPSLLQPSRAAAASLAQLRASSRAAEPTAQLRVAAFLREQAERLGSRVLSTLAIRAQDDPFAKVKKMIQDLIDRLIAQASEEADHKAWCDTELADNEATRTAKTAAVETLKSELDELHASIAKLSQEIGDLSQEIADLNKAVAEATAIRDAEKEKNTNTIADAVEAQTALSNAISVLKDFYGEAAEATALVQHTAVHAGKQTPPAIFETPYKGKQLEKDNVLAFLEVILSDFSRLEQDTSTAESDAQNEYDSFMEDSEADIKEKTKDKNSKESLKTSQEAEVTDKSAELEMTQKELNSALAYFDKLKPSCLEVGVTYTDRKSRREEEIASLQEALRILEGQDLAPPAPGPLYGGMEGSLQRQEHDAAIAANEAR